MNWIQPLAGDVRRVITGHDEKGVAQVWIDDLASNKKATPNGIVSTLVWSTDATPATMPIGLDGEDMGARIMGTAPPSNGSRFAVIDFPPHTEGAMHRTDTVDFVIVIEGEIEMLMDASSVTLRRGDVLVQRGTNHLWRNNGNNPARAAVVLLDGEQLPVDGALKGAENAR